MQELIQLRHVAKVYSGLVSQTTFIADDDGNVSVIRARDVELKTGINVNGLLRARVPEPENKLVQQGDVLFLARGDRKFATHVSEPLENTVLSSAILGIRFDAERVDPGFFCWYANRPGFVPTIAPQMSVVGSQLFREDLERLVLKLPPINVQRKIAKLMDLHRKLLVMEERRLVLREEYMQAVAHKLFHEEPLDPQKIEKGIE